jgi:uncharacterized protein (TIGR03643 family)
MVFSSSFFLTFDFSKAQFGLTEAEAIKVIRDEMTLKNWKKWRIRVQGRKTKLRKRRLDDVEQFKCSGQKQVTQNRISKR